MIKWPLDEQYPDAEQVVLICDNLNTRNIGITNSVSQLSY